MADIVGGEQRDMVNQIDNNIVTAEENIIQANVELDEARIQQKKAKKKYICLSVTIILAIIFGGILIYFFLRWSMLQSILFNIMQKFKLLTSSNEKPKDTLG